MCSCARGGWFGDWLKESISRQGVRQDKPAWCRGGKSSAEKERATPSRPGVLRASS